MVTGRGRPPIGDEASSAYSVLPIGRIIQSARVTTLPGDVIAGYDAPHSPLPLPKPAQRRSRYWYLKVAG